MLNKMKLLSISSSILLFLAACGGDADVKSEISTATPSGTDMPLRSVGISVGDYSYNPFYIAMGKGIEDAARKINPKVKITALSTKFDNNTQIDQIQRLVASEIDLLLVTAVEPKAIAPLLRKARDAGIIVVAVDVAAEGADFTVMSDNIAAGVNACEYITKRLNGNGNVVILNGPPVTVVTDRVLGCKQVLARTSGVKLLSDNSDAGGSRDGGMSVMETLLSAYPEINAVFAINDPSGVGAELAIKHANRTGIVVTAVDGSPDAVIALKDPDNLFEGSSAQNPYAMGSEGVKIGFEIMNGRKPASSIKLLPVPLVTKESVKNYPGWAKGF